MEELSTQMASLMLGHKVVDRTGLTGMYDLNAEWTPAPGPQAFGVGTATFTAIEEQLGLKLNPEQGTVDTLVIDHVERPIADDTAAGSHAVQATVAAPVTQAPFEGTDERRRSSPSHDRATPWQRQAGVGWALGCPQAAVRERVRRSMSQTSAVPSMSH
jgi:hypothetical protein